MRIWKFHSSWIASTGLHLLLAVFMFYWQQSHPVSFDAPKKLWIEVENYKPKAEELPKKEQRVQDRVVETQLVKPSKETVQDAFLGRQTQVVDRQTVSMVEKRDGKTSSKTESKKAQAEKIAEKRQNQKADPITDRKASLLSRLGVAMVPTATQAQSWEDKDWAPVPGEVVHSPQEYIKGFKESETTALNTREYVFFGYFERIKQRLDRAWNLVLQKNIDSMYRRGRRLANEMDYKTRTLVTLNNRGDVVKVQVIEESGTFDLDDAAVKAFNEAGPFPNPPTGLVDSRGEIKVRWDFVLRG